MEIKYVSKIKMYQESRKKEIVSNKFGDRILSPQMLNAVGRHFLLGDVRETMLCIALNTKNEIIAIYPAFTGTINTMIVSTREIMQFALLNNATTIALIHNHPSGNSKPSQDDINFTKRMAMACTLMKIPLIDHLVVSDDDYSSIRSYDEAIFDPVGDTEIKQLLAAERNID